MINSSPVVHDAATGAIPSSPGERRLLLTSDQDLSTDTIVQVT